MQLFRFLIAPQGIPQICRGEIDDISDNLTLACQEILRRLPCRLLRSGNCRHRTPTLSNRDRTAVLLDLVEQCEALCLELCRANDTGLHTSAYIQCGHLTSRPALPHALSGVV